MGLNKAQKQAVEHTGSPLLITAGPGTGKTRVIKDRIKFLMKSGLKPSEILCLTFSTKAAAELKTRLEQDEEIKEKLTSPTYKSVHTMHSASKFFLKTQWQQDLL